jgi:hypothetical protein
VKSSVFGTAALLMNSDAFPVLVTVTDCGALLVPVSCEANVIAPGDSETAGADVVLVVDGVQPESDVETEVVPSLTVTRHVGELYALASILNAPAESLLPTTEPGDTVTV